MDKDIYLRLLTLIDKANHLIKEVNYSEEEINNFYLIKDNFLNELVSNTPPFIKLEFSYVPYYKYSNQTKDKAGDLMRKDYPKKPFEFYLSLIEPSDNDIEIQEKATIEVEVIIDKMNFSFHVPYFKTSHWNIDFNKMTKKSWVSNKEFNKKQLSDLITKINDIMGS